MKFLIGICGIGNGHLNRQTSVINYLLKSKNEVVVATTENNKSYFEKKFKNLKVIYINIPWITCNTKGIDFKDSLKKYIDNNIDQYKSFFEFSINVEESFNGKPDLIITDYEPNVAQYSYATGIPLICMEQQSKFLFIKEEKIKNYSILEEKKRINYFFPKYDYKIISSFFPLNILDNNVKVVTPIIREIVRKNINLKKGIVYFSPYCNDKNYFLNILDMISSIDNIEFNVYTNIDFTEYKLRTNIKFKEFGDQFKADMIDCGFIISSGGHQLISEAISAEIPLFLFPLSTYEQNYNCLMVEKYKLGKKIKLGIQEEFYDFYNNLDKYILNIKNFKKEFWNKSWEEGFDEILKNI